MYSQKLKGGIITGKKSNFVHQFKHSLQKQTRYGESKHELKQKAREHAKTTGEPYQPIRGIFSTQTYKDYCNVCEQFSNYVIKNHPNCKNFYQARDYVEEWLEEKNQKGLSAWTLHLYGSALASAYNCQIKDFSFEFPRRERGNITRCRDENGSDYRNTNPRFADVKDFVRGTGARRIGLMRLTKDDIRQRSDGLYEVHLREKNNMERWAIVHPSYQETVLRLFETSKSYKSPNGEVRLFRKTDIPPGSIHDLRAEYASNMYQYFEEHELGNGILYHCRKDLAGTSYDKGLMQLVSEQLGHHRLDVVTSYLYKL